MWRRSAVSRTSDKGLEDAGYLTLRKQIGRKQPLAIGQRHRARQPAPHLAPVSGPVVRAQRLLAERGDPPHRALAPGIEGREDLVRQPDCILGSLAERRDRDLAGGEPGVQVGSEPAVRHGVLDLRRAGRDQPSLEASVQLEKERRLVGG